MGKIQMLEKPARTLAGLPLVSTSDKTVQRLSLLVWGMAGCGKTTLAATAPGKKLLVNLDTDGPSSISSRDDVEVIDLSYLKTDQVLKLLESPDNPLGLAKYFEDNDDIETLIFDSCTSAAERGLEDAVKQRLGASARFTPTMKQPGLTAYGGRNATLLTMMNGLLRVTGRFGVHFIATAHEDNATTNADGVTLWVSIMLGGKLVNKVSPKLSDIWWMTDEGKTRRLAIRPYAMHRPMKSRIFRQDGQPIIEFPDGDEDLLTRIWSKYAQGDRQKLKTSDWIRKK